MGTEKKSTLSRIEDTLASVNRRLRTPQRKVQMGVSTKDSSGYTLFLLTDTNHWNDVQRYPNKRYCHAFLSGVDFVLSMIEEEEVGKGLEIVALREYLSHERELCPRCSRDLTNRAEWLACGPGYSRAVCEGCETVLIKRDIHGSVSRVIAIKRVDEDESVE